MDLAKRKALYKQVQKTVVDECPVAFLYEAAFYEAYLGKVSNPPGGIWGQVDSITETAIKAMALLPDWHIRTPPLPR